MTASAPFVSMTLLVRTTDMRSRSFRGPDGRIGRDEEDVAVGAAEGEVDGAEQVDLADGRAGRVEDPDAVAVRRVDAALGVDLDPVRVARRDRGEEPLVLEPAVGDVENEDLTALAVA